jgi:hypothetical protein
MVAVCSCGDSETHVVGRRRSFDGVSVLLWSDGSVTSWAEALPGVPVRRPRTAETREAVLRAGWLFLDEVGLYEQDELGSLYRASEAVARRGGLPGDVRAEVARLMEPRVALRFATTAADMRGNWTEQWSPLCRGHWPGLAVLRTRAGYEVMMTVRRQCDDGQPRDCWDCTGHRFTNRRDLVRHLAEIRKTAQQRARAA